jgi:hypothetical protein
VTVKKLGLALNQQHRVCMPMDTTLSEWTITPQPGQGKRKAAHTPIQLTKPTGIRSANGREFQRKERISAPLNNRAFRTRVEAMELNGRESKHIEKLVRMAFEIDQAGEDRSQADHKAAKPRSTADAAPSFMAPRSFGSSPKSVCLQSLQCRVSGTELRGEALCCTYCGLPRAADGDRSVEYAFTRQFETRVFEEVDEF